MGEALGRITPRPTQDAGRRKKDIREREREDISELELRDSLHKTPHTPPATSRCSHCAHLDPCCTLRWHRRDRLPPSQAGSEPHQAGQGPTAHPVRSRWKTTA